MTAALFFSLSHFLCGSWFLLELSISVLLLHYLLPRDLPALCLKLLVLYQHRIRLIDSLRSPRPEKIHLPRTTASSFPSSSMSSVFNSSSFTLSSLSSSSNISNQLYEQIYASTLARLEQSIRSRATNPLAGLPPIAQRITSSLTSRELLAFWAINDVHLLTSLIPLAVFLVGFSIVTFVRLLSPFNFKLPPSLPDFAPQSFRPRIHRWRFARDLLDSHRVLLRWNLCIIIIVTSNLKGKCIC